LKGPANSILQIAAIDLSPVDRSQGFTDLRQAGTDQLVTVNGVYLAREDELPGTAGSVVVLLPA